jgi:hypothetical protein
MGFHAANMKDPPALGKPENGVQFDKRVTGGFISDALERRLDLPARQKSSWHPPLRMSAVRGEGFAGYAIVTFLKISLAKLANLRFIEHKA